MNEAPEKVKISWLGENGFTPNSPEKKMLERMEAGRHSQDTLCAFALESIKAKSGALDGSALGLPNMEPWREKNFSELSSAEKAELIRYVIQIQTRLFSDVAKQDGLLGARTLTVFEAKIKQDGLGRTIVPTGDSSSEKIESNLKGGYARFPDDILFLVDSLMKVVAQKNPDNRIGDNGWNTERLVAQVMPILPNLKGKQIVLGGQGNHFVQKGGAEKAFAATQKLATEAEKYGVKLVVNLRVPYDPTSLSPEKYKQCNTERQKYAAMIKSSGLTFFDQEAVFSQAPACGPDGIHPKGFGADSYYAKASQALKSFLDEQENQAGGKGLV